MSTKAKSSQKSKSTNNKGKGTTEQSLENSKKMEFEALYKKLSTSLKVDLYGEFKKQLFNEFKENLWSEYKEEILKEVADMIENAMGQGPDSGQNPDIGPDGNGPDDDPDDDPDDSPSGNNPTNGGFIDNDDEEDDEEGKTPNILINLGTGFPIRPNYTTDLYIPVIEKTTSGYILKIAMISGGNHLKASLLNNIKIMEKASEPLAKAIPLKNSKVTFTQKGTEKKLKVVLIKDSIPEGVEMCYVKELSHKPLIVGTPISKKSKEDKRPQEEIVLDIAEIDALKNSRAKR